MADFDATFFSPSSAPEYRRGAFPFLLYKSPSLKQQSSLLEKTLTDRHQETVISSLYNKYSAACIGTCSAPAFKTLLYEKTSSNLPISIITAGQPVV